MRRVCGARHGIDEQRTAWPLAVILTFLARRMMISVVKTVPRLEL
jgi:hypothetical protein